MGRPGKCGLILFHCIFKQQFFRDACGLPWDRPPPPCLRMVLTVLNNIDNRYGQFEYADNGMDSHFPRSFSSLYFRVFRLQSLNEYQTC